MGNYQKNMTSYREAFEKVFKKIIGKRKTPYQLKDVMNYLEKYNVNLSERTVQRYMADKVKSREIKRNGHKYTNKL